VPEKMDCEISEKINNVPDKWIVKLVRFKKKQLA
jgi:hypothetical protein